MTKDFVTIKVSVATREKVRLYARVSGLAMSEVVDKGIDLLGKWLVERERAKEPSRYANFDGKQNYIQGA